MVRQSDPVRIVLLLGASLLLGVTTFAVMGIEGDLRALDQRDLESRAASVRDYVVAIARGSAGDDPVVTAANTLHAAVRGQMSGQANVTFLARAIARADVRFGFGQSLTGPPGSVFAPAVDATFMGRPMDVGEPDVVGLGSTLHRVFVVDDIASAAFALEVTISNAQFGQGLAIRSASTAVGVLVLTTAVVLLGAASALALEGLRWTARRRADRA